MALLILLAFAVFSTEPGDPVRVFTPAGDSTTSVELQLTDAAVATAGRPVYPYSVVDGGVESAEELRAAMKRDPVVAAHFANFDLAKTRVARLQQPTLAHVSYRMGDEVFWTRRAILLPAGERILTDGTSMARTRCANQICERLEGATSPMEPPAEVMDRPDPAVRLAMLPPPGAGAPPLSGGLQTPAFGDPGPRRDVGGPTGGVYGPGVMGVPSGPRSAPPGPVATAPGHQAPADTETGNIPDDPGDPADSPDPGSPRASVPPAVPGQPEFPFSPPANPPGAFFADPGDPLLPSSDPLLPSSAPLLTPGDPLLRPIDPSVPPAPPVTVISNDPARPEIVTVPEPGTGTLMLLGGIAVLLRKRMKRRSA